LTDGARSGERRGILLRMATDGVSAHRLVRNTVANAVGSGTVAVLAVVMTPFFLRRLGPAEYGVWLLALSLTFSNGYLGLADLGLQQAGVRLIAEARSRNDLAAVNELVSTMMGMFLGLGVLLAAVVFLSAGRLVAVFDIGPDLETTARVVFLLVGLQILFDLPAAALMSLIEGAQQYSMLRLLDVGGRVLWSALVAVALIADRGVVAMGVLALVVAFAVLGLAMVLAHRLEPGLRIRPWTARAGVARRVLGQGSSLLVLRVTSIVYRQMDRAIVGIMLGAAAVARYEVVYKIHATAALMLSIAPSAVMPAAAYLGATEDEEQLRALYLRGTRYAVALCTPVSLAALLYAEPLIRTWVGASYVDLAGPTRVFLLYPVLVAVHVVGVTMLVGLGRMREMLYLSPAAVLLNLVLSLALVPRLGLVGVVWGTLAGYVVIWVPYVRLMLRSFGFTFGAWVRGTLLPNLPGAAVQLGAGFLTLRVVEAAGQLWQVGLAMALSCALSLGCFLFVVTPTEERNSLIGSLLRRRAAPV
jgi:O-antigen/teichoic acid export membrane protein